MLLTPDQQFQALLFQTKMIQLAAQFEFSVTSGGRSTDRNKAKGGAADSRHLYFCADDVVLANPSQMGRFLQAIKDLGLHYQPESDHIHIQDRPARPKPKVSQPIA